MQKCSFLVKATIWIFPVSFVFTSHFGYINKPTYSKRSKSELVDNVLNRKHVCIVRLYCYFISPFSKTVGDQYFHWEITLKCMPFFFKVLLKVTCIHMFFKWTDDDMIWSICFFLSRRGRSIFVKVEKLF